MRVRFVDSCVVSGLPHAIGEVADVSELDAQVLIQMGRAVAEAAPTPAPAPPAPPRRTNKTRSKED